MTKLLNITCTLVATCVMLRSLECILHKIPFPSSLAINRLFPKLNRFLCDGWFPKPLNLDRWFLKLNRLICDGLLFQNPKTSIGSFVMGNFIEPLHFNRLYLEAKLEQGMQYESRLCLHLHLHHGWRPLFHSQMQMQMWESPVLLLAMAFNGPWLGWVMLCTSHSHTHYINTSLELGWNVLGS